MTETPPWEETHSGQRPPGQTPPVDRQTLVKTLLSQTSFADGKYIDKLTKLIFQYDTALNLSTILNSSIAIIIDLIRFATFMRTK